MLEINGSLIWLKNPSSVDSAAKRKPDFNISQSPNWRERRRFEHRAKGVVDEISRLSSAAADSLAAIRAEESASGDPELAAARAILILDRLGVEAGFAGGFCSAPPELFEALWAPSWVSKTAHEIYDAAFFVMRQGRPRTNRLTASTDSLDPLKIILRWILQRAESLAALSELDSDAGFVLPKFRLDAEEFGQKGAVLRAGIFVRGRSGERIFVKALQLGGRGIERAVKAWRIECAHENYLIDSRDFFVPRQSLTEGPIRFVLQAADGEIIAHHKSAPIRRDLAAGVFGRRDFAIESAEPNCLFLSAETAIVSIPGSAKRALRVKAGARLLGMADKKIEIRAALRDEKGFSLDGAEQHIARTSFFPESSAAEVRNITLYLPLPRQTAGRDGSAVLELSLLGADEKPFQEALIPLDCSFSGERAAAAECPIFLRDDAAGHELVALHAERGRVFGHSAVVVDARFRLGHVSRPRQCLLELFESDRLIAKGGQPMSSRIINFGLFSGLADADSVKTVFWPDDFRGSPRALMRISLIDFDGLTRASAVKEIDAPLYAFKGASLDFSARPVRAARISGFGGISGSDFRCEVLFEVDFGKFFGREILARFDLYDQSTGRLLSGEGISSTIDLAACAERASELPGVFQISRVFSFSALGARIENTRRLQLRLSLYDAAGRALQTISETIRD